MEDEFQVYRTADQANRSRSQTPLKTVAYYAQETFAQIAEFPWYMIGNYGTIYNKRTGLVIRQHTVNKFYKVVSIFSVFEQRYKTMGVHRLIMLAHCPNQNNDNLVVNHIDAIPYHNVYVPNSESNNLEWVSCRDNIRYSFDLNSNRTKRGEESARSTFTEQQIRTLCESLSQGKSRQEAVAILGIPYDRRATNLINAIIHGRAWTYISKDYNLSMCQLQQTHDVQEIHLICQLIENGLNDKEIKEELLQFGYDTKLRFIEGIRHDTGKSAWSPIINQYNFPVKRKSYDLSDQQVEEVCRLLAMGYPSCKAIHFLKQQGLLTDHSNGSVYSFLRKLKLNQSKSYKHITVKHFKDVPRRPLPIAHS